MTNKTSLLALALVLVCAAPGRARADDLKDPFEGMYNPKRLLRGAQLTAAQLDQIRTLRRPTRDQERAIEKEIDTLATQFQDEFTSEAPIDAARFLALVEKMNQLSQKMDLMKAQSMLKIRALLTREQQARVAQAHQRMKAIDVALHALDEQRRELEAQKQSLGATIASENGL
jgi:Spy/CpxP family protein refolding chaperone